MIDQKTYEIARFQRKGEVIISAKEYEKLQKVEDMNTELINSKKILEEKIAQCESNVSLSKSNEEILADYIGDETELFYAKVPANLANEWRTFCSQQIYSKRYMLELAILNLITAPKDIQDIYNQLCKQKKSGEAKTIAISINISKNLIQKWKDYCEDTMVFSTSQLTTVALNKYMEMKVEKEQ